MNKFLHISAALMFCSGILNAQNVNEKAFYIGHSLTYKVPYIVDQLSQYQQDVTFDFRIQLINGSSLEYHYNQGISNAFTSNSPDEKMYAFTNATEGLPDGSFTQLVLTESVPRWVGQYSDEVTKASVVDFYDYATQYSPDIKVYLYEVWHCLTSGTSTPCNYDKPNPPLFRQRLDEDLAMWEGIVNYLNTERNPTHPVQLIPGGQALARLYDAIENGDFAGISSIEDFFTDDIHGDDNIRYLMACVHYMTLFEKTPIGLPNTVTYAWYQPILVDTNFVPLFQQIAYETVCNYNSNNAACTNDTTSPISINEHLNEYNVFPNPTSDYFQVHTNGSFPFNMKITDISGKTIMAKRLADKNEFIEISHLQPGLYLVEIANTQQKVVKKLVVK